VAPESRCSGDLRDCRRNIKLRASLPAAAGCGAGGGELPPTGLGGGVSPTHLTPSLVTRIDPGTVRVVVEVGGRTREAGG
jgi:hypothetical protein